ncbi:MAG: sigma-70 family RNA polymerase sigma factor [Chitinophagia bacterium]|nr:sigma-70 family RNA polymerase sigma factor [Chitinophagia bacterium]
MNDEQWLAEQCRRNNAVAQKALYNRYADELLILCLRYLPGKEDAREALMDGFLACFRNMGKFTYRGTGSLRAWLKKLMVNQCLQYLRKRKGLLFVSEQYYSSNEPADTASPIDKLSANEIMALIHALPDGYRTIFNLYVFDDMDHKEIATLLGISESTSKSQLHRARALLQTKILQHC